MHIAVEPLDEVRGESVRLGFVLAEVFEGTVVVRGGDRARGEHVLADHDLDHNVTLRSVANLVDFHVYFLMEPG